MKTKSPKRFTGLILAAAILTIAQTASAAEVSLKVAKVEGGGTSVVIPITIDKCEGMGALQFDLIYDPAIAEPESVDAGAALSNALIEFKIKSPGRLGVALIFSEPVTKSGELLKIKFKPIPKASGSTPLEITNQLAWDHKNNLEMLITTEPGSLTLVEDSELFPAKWRTPAMIAGAVLLIIIMFFLFGRSRKK